jgi:DNA-directed RNA polymerase specialized sigma24 family protein
MAGAVQSGSFRISPVDRLGRRIDPAVLAAVEQILPMAVWHGSRLLGDPAVIANLLEEAAAIVSRRFRSQDSPQQIRKVAAYLYVCFLRKVNRVKRKQVLTVSLEETVRSRSAWADPSAQFDMKILIDEFLAQCDSDAQDMFLRRIEGRSWGEIGRLYELSGQKRREITEEEFLGFARSYLSEAFPNPERIGCPPDSELKGLAEHPKGADPLISPHLTHCSPCFNRYMKLLDELKRAKPG